jgi:hypothetical protein
MATIPLMMRTRMLDPRFSAILPKIMYITNTNNLVVSHGAAKGY